MQIYTSPVFKEISNNYTQFSQIKNINTTVSDSVSINEMSEELTENAFGQRHSILEGNINKQNAIIKKGYDYNADKRIYKVEAEGTIGSKKIIMHQDFSQRVTGSYNNKNFDLNLDIKYKRKKGDPGEGVKSVYINGTIDNKPFEIMMPNAKVPQDNDIKDILTTVLCLNYLAPFTIDGKIIDILPSHGGFEAANYHQEEKTESINRVKDYLLPVIVGSIFGTIPIAFKKMVDYIKHKH